MLPLLNKKSQVDKHIFIHGFSTIISLSVPPSQDTVVLKAAHQLNKASACMQQTQQGHHV
jgi:hypothetical protein